MQASIIRLASGAALAVATFAVPLAPAFAGQEGRPLISTAKPSPWMAVRSVSVSYADLNLLNQHGRDRLNDRIQRAAQVVCDLEGGIQPLKTWLDGRTCYSGAMERAHRDIAIVVAQARSTDRLARRAGDTAVRVSSR